MELKEIQELIKLLEESKLSSLKLEKEGFKLELQKDVTSMPTHGMPYSLPPAGYPAPVAPEKGTPETPVLTPGLTVKSPIVGTFFGAAAPGEAPFVKAGSQVKAGDPLCIIEAMKLMNEIEAEEDLVILEVLVQDGQMVEYGQPLFRIRKSTTSPS